jgi:PIN domain nuclease of toxin-antitoxin system
MVKTEHRVGRLVELTVASPVTVAEVQACIDRFAALAIEIKGKFVVVVDIRKAVAFSQDVAGSFGKLMRADNTRLERSAILVGESAVLSLQMDRMVREAQNPMRRTFRSADALVTWFGAVLSLDERARVSEFLA